MRRATAAALGAIVLAACGDAHRATPAIDSAIAHPLDTARSTTDSASLATDTVSHAAMPSLVSVADSAAGDSLYRGKGRCFTCHGESASGQPSLGPSLRDSVWLDGDGSLASIREVVTNGISAPHAKTAPMPAFRATLASSEIERVSAYVYALSHPGSVIPASARVDSMANDTANTAAPAGSAPHDSGGAPPARRPPKIR